MIRESESMSLQNHRAAQGDPCVLESPAAQSRVFRGRVWSDADEWWFQEDLTGLKVSVPMRATCERGRAGFYASRDARLARAMVAKVAESRADETSARRRERAEREMPRSVEDLSTHRAEQRTDGKITFSYGSQET